MCVGVREGRCGCAIKGQVQEVVFMWVKLNYA